jgi:hypothetical protein
LPTKKFAHDEACFQATVGLEGTVKLPGGFLELLVSHKLSGHRKMLEQFRGGFFLGAFGRDTGFCLAQRYQSMGISAGGGELETVSVIRAECQTARFDFMNDVFTEHIAGDQS